MSENKGTAKASMLRELLSFEIYKRSQGRIVRQVTGLTLVLGVAFALWSLYSTIGGSQWVRYGITISLGIVGLWAAFRAVNYPRFADFLISVESEMSRVSWPDSGTLVRSSSVVLLLIVGFSAVLLFYDYFWRLVLQIVLALVG